MSLPSVALLTKALVDLLDDQAGLTVYESVVELRPPTDQRGVTRSYAVVHPFPGDAESNQLDRQPGRLLWGFQVSCVGGNHDYVLGAVDAVRRRLDGKRLTVDGVVVGLMQPPPGYQPPAPKAQPVDSGQRLQVPLLYQVLTVPA